MKARVGGGGAFMCAVPIGLEVRGRDRWGLRRGDIWGPAEGGDKLSGILINLWGTDKGTLQDSTSSRRGAIHANTMEKGGR